jgi:outer membrane protein OmpA-like peptidoglycan-associated protein
MKKILISIALLLIFWASEAISDPVLVQLGIKDNNGDLVPNIEMEIFNLDDESVLTNTTGAEGLAEQKLEKGENFKVVFYFQSSNLPFNFRVPLKKGNFIFKKVFTTHYDFSNENSANTLEYKPDEVLATITIQNEDKVRLIDHPFKLYDKEQKLIMDTLTSEKGSFKTILKKEMDYTLVTAVYGREYDAEFMPETEVNIYKLKLTLPYPSDPMHARGDTIYNYGEPVVKNFTLENVYFETGKHNLQEQSSPALDNFFGWLSQNAGLIVEIGGHTDNVGNAKMNQRLSERRAKEVRKYLIKKGIDPDRLKTMGYGELVPIDSNDTPEGRAKNRRTDIKIVTK